MVVSQKTLQNQRLKMYSGLLFEKIFIGIGLSCQHEIRKSSDNNRNE